MWIEITQVQAQQLAVRAAAEGRTMDEIVSAMLDRELGITSARIEAIDATSGILADAADWPEWQAAIRGRPLDERLTELGL